MRLFVQPVGRWPQPTGVEGAWILLWNSWNDFSYRTLFALYREHHGELSRYGFVKILRRGQVEHETPLEEGEIVGGRLPEDYGSLGQDLDYYERLNELPEPEKTELLEALGDLATDPAKRAGFAGEPGLATSLNRDRERPQDFYEDVSALILRGVAAPPRNMRFAFRPVGAHEPIAFDFRGRDDEARQIIPGEPSRRLIVLVGPNGVGKTSLLASIARVAYAAPRQRDALAREGQFEGDPVFPSVTAVAYSAFDDFKPPHLDGSSDAEIARQLREGEGRYAYCGMRDLAHLVEAPGEPARLLTLDDLGGVFSERIRQLEYMKRMTLLARVLAPVFEESSFRPLLAEGAPDPDELDFQESDIDRLRRFLGDNSTEAFGNLSSGHRIVLHLLTNMTATLKRHGIALIDEPEVHLHPPLLAALMNGLRRLLAAQNAHAIVATHSPVVVQETLASHVMIMEPGGVVRAPASETFGENTGTLTREIFGLHTDTVDFRRALDALANALPSVEAIEAHLGSPLSSPALAYVAMRLNGR
ncbi:MAG: AAA family ATPase [Caulobacter sp.]